MTRKKKYPPISAERQEICDGEGFDAETTLKIHQEICDYPEETLSGMARARCIPWFDRERTGNALIIGYANRQRLFRQKCANLATARARHWDEFQKTFGRSLADFWEGNALGLDVIKLDRFIETPDGISMAEFIKTKYGADAVAMVKEMMNGVTQ